MGFSRQEYGHPEISFPPFLIQCMKVKSESEVVQSLSDPMDCSLPGSSIHGIFQARVLEWGAIAFSAGEEGEYLKDMGSPLGVMKIFWN